MKADLHLHTTASDGDWTPEQVVGGAVAGGLDVIAVTDHDTVAGVARARHAAKDLTLSVISGIEVSSTFQGRDVHILGYFVDVEAPVLVGYGTRAGRRREERMREMLGKLSAQGIEIPYERVEAAAGSDPGVIGRPHLARALVEAGHVTSVSGAFASLIGDDSDAFVPAYLLEPRDAVELVLAAGGVPVWAHPPSEIIDALLPALIEVGLRGLEVYRPRNRRADVLRLEELCRSRGLLASGGSDWHTPRYGSMLGDFHVTSEEVGPLLATGGMWA